jgi:hypothetical protein
VIDWCGRAVVTGGEFLFLNFRLIASLIFLLVWLQLKIDPRIFRFVGVRSGT